MSGTKAHLATPAYRLPRLRLASRATMGVTMKRYLRGAGFNSELTHSNSETNCRDMTYPFHGRACRTPRQYPNDKYTLGDPA